MKQAALQIPDTYYETHKILDEVSFNELVKSVILDRKKAGFSRFKYAGKSELLQKIWPKLNCGLEILKMIN